MWQAELHDLLRQMQEVMKDPNLSWEERYDAIFCEELSTRVFRLMCQHDIDYSYYDPDSDYEDDVRAYVEAMTNKIGPLPNPPQRSLPRHLGYYGDLLDTSRGTPRPDASQDELREYRDLWAHYIARHVADGLEPPAQFVEFFRRFDEALGRT